MDHPLGSKELRALLYSVGLPRTEEEEHTLDCLAKSYRKMGFRIPSSGLAGELNALYSKSESAGSAVLPLAVSLISEHVRQSLELNGIAPYRLTPGKKKGLSDGAFSKAYHSLARDFMDTVERYRELRFRSLQLATKRINAVLTTGGEKKK